MDLKKALTYIAFGFLFTLVNFNLTLNGTSINVTPDFIGWILFFLAYDKLGGYISSKPYMKWAALVLAVVSCGLWVLELTHVEFDVSAFNTVVSITSLIYMFVLFGSLEKVAEDKVPNRTGTIRILKYLNVALYALFVLTAVVFQYAQNPTLLYLTGLFGLAVFVAAIYTAVVLFGLRKDILNRPEEA